jgi:protein gp37
MAKDTKIEWCDHTVNLWWGCTKVHAGCDNCYAEKWSDRFRKKIPSDDENTPPTLEPSLWGEGVPRKRIKSAFPDLAKYQRQAEKEGENHKIFVGSMMDIFEKSKPLSNPTEYEDSTGYLRMKLLGSIMEGQYPNLTFLLLTKRPSNINKYIPEWWIARPPQNVYFGCSPVDQKTYNNFIKQMAKVGGNKFLSIEPQLGHIDLLGAKEAGIKWIIQGGESGPGKRPFDLAWADSMREQCKELGIAYFFKQIDKIKPIPTEYLIRETPF